MSSPALTLKDLLELLKPGADSAWRDAGGNSLLHHAARFGESGLVSTCLEMGVKAGLYNNDGECARDVARAWGYDAVASQIDAAMQKENAAPSPTALSYTSLQDIRDQSAATGVNLLHRLAAQGLFAQVAGLAEKTSESFTLDDLTAIGSDGDKVILKICQQGQILDLLRPQLWASNATDFRAVLENVPKVYKRDIDIDAFMNRVRHQRLQSRAIKPQWKKGPK